MNLGQQLIDLAKPLFRPQSGPLHKMSDDELADAIATLEARVREGEQQIARLQPELEAAAAEAFAGADLATVESNQAAVREAELTLANARTTLNGLRGEVNRRAAEGDLAHREQRRKTFAAALDAYEDQAAHLDAALAAFAAQRSKTHAAREAAYQAYPQNGRVDQRELLLPASLDNKTDNDLYALTDGRHGRPKGLLSATILREQVGIAASVAPLQQMAATVIF